MINIFYQILKSKKVNILASLEYLKRPLRIQTKKS